MQEISNSLRQRLRARPQPQAHPDPDILTAYVEQVLPATERTQVVMHLSECSYCREVVSLSLAQPESQQLVQHVAVRSRFWIPAFRWGAAVAMVAVATTLVVEKPWRTSSSRQVLPATLSQASPPAPPPGTVTGPERTAATNEPAASAGSHDLLSSDRLRSVDSEAKATQKPAAPPQQTGTISEIVVNRAASSPQKTEPPKALGAVGGVAQEHALESLQVQAQSREAMATRATLTQEAASTTVDVDAGQDYVNTNALRKGRADNNGTIVSADDASLPAAPAPKIDMNGKAALDRRGGAPRLTAENTRDQYSITLAPPNLAATSPPSAGDASLAKSSFGYKLKSRIDSAVSAVKRAGGVQSTPGSRSFSPATTTPRLKQSESGNEAKAESRQEFWRVVNGTLMKSSDGTEWHEAYPQGPELQFKVVIGEGRQVWAGGSNATLIYSWDGGGNWEKFKVPDSGDVTAITLDDGWQVKTSNGRTFVSQDHGKTWNQDPK